MITEDYVSFETAKLLKEKGFNEKTYRCYNLCTEEHELSDVDDRAYNNWELADDGAAAPTLQMAMKWLREVHHIDICTEPHSYSAAEGKTSNYEVSYWQEDNYVAPYSQRDHELSGKTWEKYEDACESAIRYCVENLI